MTTPLDDPFGEVVDPTPAPADAPVAAAPEPQPLPDGDITGEDTVPARGTPVAGGRRVSVPAPRPLPAWNAPNDQDLYDSGDGGFDYSDLERLNRDMLQLRIRMSKVRRAMRQASREAVEAKLSYQRALRRALIQQSGGSAEMRKAAAELMCEDLEADWAMRQQVAEEFTTLFRSIRDDIENAKVVSYNLRALTQVV